MEKKKVIAVLFLLLAAVSCREKPKQRALPFAGNYDIVTYEKDGEYSVDTVYPKIPPFRYLNQDSQWVSSASMAGKIWIANFFFTSCPSICPPMMSQMKRLNILTKDIAGEVQFMSFSIDPETDRPHTLREYIAANGIQTVNWQFFTGNETATHELGVKHFLVHAANEPLAPGGFAHSDGLVLVDREGHVRGVYPGTSTESVDQLNKDVRKLLRIEYGIECKEK